MLDYLAIGHIAQDVTPDGLRLGGTAAYAALTAHALSLRVGLVTAAAPDAVMDGLADLMICRVPSPRSTIFENRYTSAGRTQTIHSQAESLTPAAVPAEWRDASIIHLAPIAREVDPALASLFPNSFVGLTPQGWMRRWDGNGRVTRGEWDEAESLLPSASATVTSIEDVGGDWNIVERWAARTKVFVATQGDQGATVFWDGDRRHFSAPNVRVVDPTGAGDIFAAAFFVRLWQTRDAWDAAPFAIALASESVTRAGVMAKTKVRSRSSVISSQSSVTRMIKYASDY